MSASGTGEARASDGGTAVSGSVVGSTVSSTTIAHQNNRWYSLFSGERTAGRSLLPSLVLLGVVVALVRQPQGRMSQFTLVYVLLGAALLASVALAFLAGETTGGRRAAPPPARPSRAPSARTGIALLTALLCLVATGTGLLRVEYLRDHGEVSAAGRYTLKGATGVADGGAATLILDGGTDRDRVKFTVALGEPYRGEGNCVPGARLGVALEGTPETSVKLVKAVATADLRIGGGDGTRILLIVHVDDGCSVNLRVTDVLLYG
ncbi:hypothetical protein JNUCC64_16205 [Streptomyces sp. JNUCC 64]